MRKILRSSCMAFFILVLPFSLAVGQDKKSEQKIKIMIDDGSGKKVVVDTVFKNSPVPDSLILKDGTVVLIKHKEEESDLKHHNGKDHLFMTYSSNGKDEGKEYKEVTIISSDSLNLDQPGKKGDVYFYSNSVSDDDKDSKVEKSRYIIAKDGIVVTIEGKDETKTRALAKEIEEKLGVNNHDSMEKESLKSESKKTTKK